MKILHISTAKSWRGGEQQVANLLIGLQKMKAISYQHLLCIKNTSLENFAICNSVEVSTSLKPKISWIFLIPEICKYNKIDIVHVHDSSAHTLAIIAQVFYKMKVKIVVSRKVIFPIKNKWFTKFKYTHPSVKSIICVSKEVQKIVQKSIPKAKTTIIMDSINTERNLVKGFLKEKYLLGDKIIVGYVAALSEEKDHKTFLKVVKKILQEYQNIIFLIIGEGKMKEELTNKVKEERIEKNVIFTGFIKNVACYLPDIDICLFTSKSEGLGSSILDFYEAKVPVISTNAGGLKNIIKNNKTGFLCEVGDVNCLKNKVIEVIQNKSKTIKIVENAFNYVNKNHSISEFTNKHINLYKKILNI